MKTHDTSFTLPEGDYVTPAQYSGRLTTNTSNSVVALISGSTVSMTVGAQSPEAVPFIVDPTIQARQRRVDQLNRRLRGDAWRHVLEVSDAN